MDFNFIWTVWSLLPPVVAIALALKTKEVYSSLFIGIVLGAILYSMSMGTGTIRHHHHGIGWCRVQARSPRVIAVALRPNRSPCVVPNIRCGGIHPAARHCRLCRHFVDSGVGYDWLGPLAAEKIGHKKVCVNKLNADFFYPY